VKEANVNIAMISYYFGGKEYLYQEVFKQFCISQKKIPNYLAIFPDEPTKALESYLMYIFDHLDDDPEIALITYQEILAPNARFLDVIPYIKSSWRITIYITNWKRKKEFNFTSLFFTMHWISSFVILPKYQMFLTMALDENIDTITNREKDRLHY
jgi:AcrR family transcriptional regulator